MPRSGPCAALPQVCALEHAAGPQERADGPSQAVSGGTDQATHGHEMAGYHRFWTWVFVFSVDRACQLSVAACFESAADPARLHERRCEACVSASGVA